MDHVFGDDTSKTGYGVIVWVELAFVIDGFKPPKILVHLAKWQAFTRILPTGPQGSRIQSAGDRS
jgi:hypothetical protein